MLIPRHLQIDFGGISGAWAPHPEFAAILNSGSPLTWVTEPYLNIVMARARDKLGSEDAELKADIDAFIRQEAYHYRLHDAFNRELYAAGYSGLKPVADRLRASLKARLEQRSLVDNLAYCTAFENLATYMAKFVFGEASDLLAKADARVVAMWKWHMAEEFEHRSVCHRALAALSGSYFVRVHGLVSMLRHLAPFQKDAGRVVLDKDREMMTAGEVKESIRREKAYRRLFDRCVTFRMATIARPFYDPADHAAPPGLWDALAEYQQIAEEGIPAGAPRLAIANSI